MTFPRIRSQLTPRLLIAPPVANCDASFKRRPILKQKLETSSRTMVIILLAVLLGTGCEAKQQKAQNLFDQGRYEEVIAQYPDQPITRFAKEKLQQAATADSLERARQARTAAEAAAAEAGRRAIYLQAFNESKAYAQALANRLELRNERIAAMPFPDLLQRTFTRSFQSEAVTYHDKMQHELDAKSAWWVTLKQPHYLQSHTQMKDVIDRLSNVETLVYLTYAAINPVAVQYFGFDQLMTQSARSVVVNRRELANLRDAMANADRILQNELSSSSN